MVLIQQNNNEEKMCTPFSTTIAHPFAHENIGKAGGPSILRRKSRC